jgi:hypothetical protein
MIVTGFLPFLLHGSLRSVGISSSLKVSQNSAVNPSGFGPFFWKTIAASISLFVIDIFSDLYPLALMLFRHMCLEIYHSF